MARSFRRPAHITDIAKLYKVQRRTAKMISSMGNKSYHERLTRLIQFYFAKMRRPRGELTEGCKLLIRGIPNVEARKMFSVGNFRSMGAAVYESYSSSILFSYFDFFFLFA